MTQSNTQFQYKGTHTEQYFWLTYVHVEWTQTQSNSRVGFWNQSIMYFECTKDRSVAFPAVSFVKDDWIACINYHITGNFSKLFFLWPNQTKSLLDPLFSWFNRLSRSVLTVWQAVFFHCFHCVHHSSAHSPSKASLSMQQHIIFQICPSGWEPRSQSVSTSVQKSSSKWEIINCLCQYIFRTPFIFGQKFC